MSIREYLNQNSEIQNHIIHFLDDDKNENFESKQILFKILEEKENLKDNSEFKLLIRLISMIANNTKRCSGFFDKIGEILDFCKSRIKQTFTNNQIFDIFQNNKSILLLLIEKGILKLDEQIINNLKLPKFQVPNRNYIEFFRPEIDKFDDFFDEDDYSDFGSYESFLISRKIGENNNLICQLIQQDNITEFVSFCTQDNFNLNCTIKPSIFETNPFLFKNKPTLIEYAAFCGSIQIFQYLMMNECELKSSLWLYAIHGKCADIIHYLEENKIQPKQKSFERCIIESIKCHHIDIYEYIMNNFIQNKNDLNENYIISKKLKFVNFETINDDDINNCSAFYDLCQYNYDILVELILKKFQNDTNFLSSITREIILKHYFE